MSDELCCTSGTGLCCAMVVDVKNAFFFGVDRVVVVAENTNE